LPVHGVIVPRERAERKRERDQQQQSKPTHRVLDQDGIL
jgi:hypothetical protein